MPRRYYSPRRRKNNAEYRRKNSVLLRPSVQITILLVTALIIYIILVSANK